MADPETNSIWDDVVWPEENFSAIRIYSRDLPHWRLDGGLYFVTFRLADSIPYDVVAEWQSERARFLALHGIHPGLPADEWSRRYEDIDAGVRRAFEREEARRLFVELDRCHGSCRLRVPGAARIVSDSLRHFDGERLGCGDFVVMPNHVHWLVIPRGTHALEEILHSVKLWTARQINRLDGKEGTFWQRESFDHLVRGPEELVRIREYIRDNPVKARLKSDEYSYYVAKPWF